MSAIDIGIVVFSVAMAVVGFDRGLAASVPPLVGFVGGVALGARLAPALLDGGSSSPYAPAASAASGVLLGVFLAIALEGVGLSVAERIASSPGRRLADGFGGAFVFAGLGLVIAWVCGAVALNAPTTGQTSLRRAVQRSEILARLNEALPPSGPILNALRRIDPTPAVRGPQGRVAPPDARLVRDPEVRTAARSVVRILGTACGLGVEGSGWVAGPGMVVTNAHVVAGEDDTTVTVAGGGALAATAIDYEPANDLAILRVDGLTAAPLELRDGPIANVAGSTIGYPENGPLTVAAARAGRTGVVNSQDSYGRGPLRRRMTPLRGVVRSGNSGGPVVDGDGRVLTTVFAAALGGGEPRGLGVPNEVVAKALHGPLRPTWTGPCAR